MAVISFPTSIGGVHIPSMSKAGGPLAALFGDVFGLDVLKYPQDLGSSTRAHYVTFRIYDIIPFSLEGGSTWSFSDLMGGGSSNFLDKVTNFFDDFTKNLNLSSLTAPLSEQKAEISLYIPDSVTFDYSAQYGEVILNPLAAGNALENLPGIIGGVANKVAAVASSDVGKLFLRSQGLAINPNQQLMFDSIPLRTFSFEFVFMPKSKQETDDVKKIIEAFKMYSRPRTVEGSYGMIFVPPSIFKIDFRFLNGRNQYINKVADSVVENVEIDYTPNGWSTHQDGSPVNIKMKVQFKELSLIDRDGATSVARGY
jgi:hypothetical protein